MRSQVSIAAFAIMVWMIPSVVFAADATSTCLAFVNHIHDKAITIVHDGKQSFADKHKALEDLFADSVDVKGMGERAAGAYWRGASEAERTAYDEAYRAYVVNYYVGSMDENDIAGIEDIVVTKFNESGKGIYHARLKITQKHDDPVRADLHLEDNNDGDCRIEDFSVEGVSVAASQKEEIQSLGKIGGIELITKTLVSRKH